MLNSNMILPDISLILFGIILLAGLIGGEVARRTVIFPQLCGYILIGLILGPSMLNCITVPMLKIASLYVDVCFGIILFELGKNIYVKSFINDPWLPIGGIVSCVICFIFIFTTLFLFNFEPEICAVVASIGVTTSPAVIYMIARELDADGPIVRRTKSLVAINNVIGILAFVTLLPYLHYRFNIQEVTMWAQPIYILLGSLGLSLVAFASTFGASVLIGKIASKQFILVIAMIIMQIGLCYSLELSTIICMLSYGICMRNLNYKNYILNVDFGYIADLLFLMLFVITGANLSWVGVDKYIIPVCLVLVARAIAQFIAIYLSSCKSGFTKQQSFLAGLSLAPFSVSALGISQAASKLYPEFETQISHIIISLLLITSFLGPIITRWSFKTSERKSF